MALSDEKEVFGSEVTLLTTLPEDWPLGMWYANLIKKWVRNDFAGGKEAQQIVSLPLWGVHLEAMHHSELKALVYDSSSRGGVNCAEKQ